MDRPSAIYESEKQLKALADVLEGKEYKNTGATRGQSKWLKYIAELTERNQVFGPKIIKTEIMPEQTLTFNDYEGLGIVNNCLVTWNVNIDSIIPGEVYDINFNGTLYKQKCLTDDSGILFGNLSLMGGGSVDNTGESFLIIPLENNGENAYIMCATTLGAGDYTISISKTETIIKKIPKEYLPDDIGSGPSEPKTYHYNLVEEI